ncbi:peptide chain release factor N(5)-glutamine methyltransferase [Erythrobacter sp. YT30]|uniref:peptide chain release factor N(5)-glutamine methyltransferase n=1 Tax=Erythrobacter sp. YT30 TaxID=1735012 RepID=UPI00076BE8DE|nr:peptide chain release factor N(5)-glutamine methyltransferase [Erythrobacter sp. YT30]KWV91209.1 protein-(glutamine-N5) methyltransferase, release factor-specific [Erythrobacter sp. YT30]
MKVADALRAGAEQLAATSDTARLDAQLLMAHALNVTRSEMLLRFADKPSPQGFSGLIERRLNHEPIAYITGWTEFYGRRFNIAPGVLIPRGDSEVLIEAALEICPDAKRVLDLGVGSGALLLTILCEKPKASGVGVDASSEAIEIAGENAITLQAAGELNLATAWAFREADWSMPGWSDDIGAFDLILCNPPYVETSARLDPDVRNYEPASALFAGADGLDDYRVLIPQLRALMENNGVALFEIGHLQSDAVTKLAYDAGFEVQLRHDLANRPRVLILS